MRVLLLFILFSPLHLFAQPERLEFGAAPPAPTLELDTTIGAYLAYEWLDLTHEYRSNGGRGRVVIHRQIVVTSERGFEYADMNIPFSTRRGGGGRPLVRALITQPDGTQTELSAGDFLEKKENDHFSQLVFAFPKVQVGSRLETWIDYSFPAMSEPPNYTFVRELPVQQCVVHLNGQKKFNYRAAIRAAEVDDEEIDAGNVYTITPAPDRVDDPELVYIAPRRETYFVAKNLPAERNLPYVRHRPNYEASVEFYTVGVTRMLTSEDKSTSWDKIGDMFQYSPYFGGKQSVKAQRQIGKLTKHLTLPEDTELARATQLFRWLTDRVHWNENYKLQSPPTPKQLLSSKRGSSADLALTFSALLRHADFDADAVLVRAPEMGLNYRAFPELAQFSSVLVRATLDDTVRYFDPTAENLRAGLVSPRLLGPEVFEPVQGRWYALEVPLTTSTITVDARIEDGELVAEWTGTHDHYHAYYRRNRLTDDTEAKPLDAYRDYYFDRYLDADDELEDLQVQGTDTADRPIVETVTLYSSDLLDEAGELLYLTPLLRESFRENPLDEPTRSIPLESSYGSAFRFSMNLDLPENYAVESLPQPASLQVPATDIRARYEVQQTDSGSLRIEYELYQNEGSVPAERYPEVRAFFDELVAKQREVIVLRRVGE